MGGRDAGGRSRPSLAEWRWALEAALVLPLVGLGLRVLGLGACMSLLRRVTPALRDPGAAAPGRDEDQALARSIARGVGIAARHGAARPACLGRSMALWWMLRGRGLDAHLRIGVRPGPGAPDAHAWVEHRGEVLIDAPDVVARFAVLRPAPAGGAGAWRAGDGPAGEFGPPRT